MKKYLFGEVKEKLPTLQYTGSYVKLDDMPSDLPEICFLGRSNSGKSSMLGRLGQNPAMVKTSKRPGHTTTINLFTYKNVVLADLPGYGYAKTGQANRNLMSSMISEYIQNRNTLKAGFLLNDCKRIPSDEEKYIASIFKERNIPLYLLLTKVDRLNQKEKAKLKKEIKTFEDKFFHCIPISSRSGENMDFLINFNLFQHNQLSQKQ